MHQELNILVINLMRKLKGMRSISKIRRDLVVDKISCFILGTISALSSTVLLIMVYNLYVQAQPAIKCFGLRFLSQNVWDPERRVFGGFSAICGTLLTSIIALIISFPIGFGSAIFLHNLKYRKVKLVIKTTIDMLGSVPSIVFGMWGMMSFINYYARYVQLPLQHIEIPLFRKIFCGPPVGIGILPSGSLLAVMIFPFITSLIYSLLESFPTILKESAYGLGSTQWEVIRKIFIPYAKQSILNIITQCTGRLIGEAMAISFIVGNCNYFQSLSLFMPSSTIASVLSNEFSEASSLMHKSALSYLSLLLLVMMIMISLLSKVTFNSLKK